MPTETANFADSRSPEGAHPTISSGSVRLDIALGTGGYPAGTIIEISGRQSSGKTCLCQHAIAEAQRSGGVCAYIDADRTFSLDFARHCGVRVDELYFCEPACTEQALGTLEILARSGAFALIVLDSFQSLTPAAGLAGDGYPDQERHLPALNQELLSSSLARIGREVRRTGTIIIVTNDANLQMSAAYHQLSANPHRLALKLHAGLRIRLRTLEDICSGKLTIGSKIQAHITRNRFFPLLNTTDFDIIYPQGINKTAEIFALGIFIRKIRKQSGGYTYQTVPLGQTSSQALHFLEENRPTRDEVERDIRRILLPNNIIAAT